MQNVAKDMLQKVEQGAMTPESYASVCRNMFGAEVGIARDGCEAIGAASLKKKAEASRPKCEQAGAEPVHDSDVSGTATRGEAEVSSENRQKQGIDVAPWLAATSGQNVHRCAAGTDSQIGSGTTLSLDKPVAPWLAAAKDNVGVAQESAAAPSTAGRDAGKVQNNVDQVRSTAKCWLSRPRGRRGYGKRLWRRQQVEASRNAGACAATEDKKNREKKNALSAVRSKQAAEMAAQKQVAKEKQPSGASKKKRAKTLASRWRLVYARMLWHEAAGVESWWRSVAKQHEAEVATLKTQLKEQHRKASKELMLCVDAMDVKCREKEKWCEAEKQKLRESHARREVELKKEYDLKIRGMKQGQEREVGVLQSKVQQEIAVKNKVLEENRVMREAMRAAVEAEARSEKGDGMAAVCPGGREDSDRETESGQRGDVKTRSLLGMEQEALMEKWREYRWLVLWVMVAVTATVALWARQISIWSQQFIVGAVLLITLKRWSMCEEQVSMEQQEASSEQQAASSRQIAASGQPLAAGSKKQEASERSTRGSSSPNDEVEVRMVTLAVGDCVACVGEDGTRRLYMLESDNKDGTWDVCSRKDSKSCRTVFRKKVRLEQIHALTADESATVDSAREDLA